MRKRAASKQKRGSAAVAAALLLCLSAGVPACASVTKGTAGENVKEMQSAAIASLAPASGDSSVEQRYTGAPLGIDEAVKITLRDNTTLRSLRQELTKAQAFKLKADGTILPAVSVNGVLDTQREPQTTDGSDRSGGRSATASIEETIYSGGRNSALRAQSPQVRTIAESAVAAGENRAVGELYIRFYLVLLKRKQVETELAAVETSKMHLKQVEQMAKLGLSNRLEVIRAGQQVAAKQASLEAARGAYDVSVTSLMNYMAIEPQNSREVVGELYEPAANGDREHSLALAMQHRADLMQSAEQVKFRENQIRIERSGMLPKLTAGATTGWSDPYRQRDESGDTWRAELRLAVPVFDRWITRSSVMTVQAEREQDKIALEQKELDIKSEVEASWSEIESSHRALRSSEKSLELAEETLRLAEIGFTEGVTPQLDLLDAQNSLTLAQLEFIGAQYNYLIAVTALKVTEGMIIEWNGDKTK